MKTNKHSDKSHDRKKVSIEKGNGPFCNDGGGASDEGCYSGDGGCNSGDRGCYNGDDISDGGYRNYVDVGYISDSGCIRYGEIIFVAMLVDIFWINDVNIIVACVEYG